MGTGYEHGFHLGFACGSHFTYWRTGCGGSAGMVSKDSHVTGACANVAVLVRHSRSIALTISQIQTTLLAAPVQLFLIGRCWHVSVCMTYGYPAPRLPRPFSFLLVTDAQLLGRRRVIVVSAWESLFAKLWTD